MKGYCYTVDDKPVKFINEELDYTLSELILIYECLGESFARENKDPDRQTRLVNLLSKTHDIIKAENNED